MFGFPVEHSLSPAMHNAAIAATGLHYVYIPFSVRPEEIGPAIFSLHTLGIIGVNLTIPHKVRVLPYLDEISPEARAVGAVNTVHVVGGRLHGYNTDGHGFMAPLRARGFVPAGKRALILGAGGAARAVAFRLAQEGMSLVIANRDPARAEALAGDVRTWAKEGCVSGQGLTATAEPLEEADLIVNVTPLGMHPDVDAMPPIPVNRIHSGQIVYDTIYNPPETRLLAAARAVGAETINGVQMLVHQGAESFRIWTTIAPPVDVMEEAIIEGLRAQTGAQNGERGAWAEEPVR